MGVLYAKVNDVWTPILSAGAVNGGGGGSTDWTAITNKPATFPPSTHSHTHTHPWADVTGEPSFLALTGGTMTGNINMNQYVLYNPKDPTSTAHVGDVAYNDIRYAMDAHTHSGVYSPAQHSNTSHTTDYEAVGHTHSEYALQGHGDPAHTEAYAKHPHGNPAHDPDYMPTSGGTFTSNVTVNGWTSAQGGMYVDDLDFWWRTIYENGDSGQTTLRIFANGRIFRLLSSRAWKRDIEDAEDLAERVLQLRPVTYIPLDPDPDMRMPDVSDPGDEKEVPGVRSAGKMKHFGERPSPGKRIGLIAEEVEEIFPELVGKNADGEPETIAYDMLSVAAIAACQDLDQRLRALEGAT